MQPIDNRRQHWVLSPCRHTSFHFRLELLIVRECSETELAGVQFPDRCYRARACPLFFHGLIAPLNIAYGEGGSSLLYETPAACRFRTRRIDTLRLSIRFPGRSTFGNWQSRRHDYTFGAGPTAHL